MSRRVILSGDFNLDSDKKYDTKYRHKTKLGDLLLATDKAGLKYHATPPTWRSYGLHKDRGDPKGAHRESTIDHVYTAGVHASVKVLDDASSDHRPIVTHVSANNVASSGKLITIRRRNFKKINRQSLEAALLECDFSRIYAIGNVDESLEFLETAIVAALDRIAPLREIVVRQGKSLYLERDTLNLMKMRDAAKGAKFRKLRNRVSVLVERDKQASNERKLAKSKNDPRILWELANAALGKARPSLPNGLNVDGTMTDGKRAAAEAMNRYYEQKVVILRKGIAPAGGSTSAAAWPPRSKPFSFSFTNAGKISKIIKGLGSTTAVGVDGIPVGVLKLGVEVLAGPISHVINRSLATGCVPQRWKQGIIKPVYKGGSKPRADPSSYRPVCLLCSLSKVLETTVKSDLVAHFAETDAIPTTQHGFRAGRSCSTALASAQAGWLSGLKAGQLVGILGFDLSSAFDTLHPSTLLDKLESVGIKRRSNAFSWFESYLVGGEQQVDWDGERSEFARVLFGVRQGSILGPILFLLHTADMASAVGTALNVTYADDSTVWCYADTADELKNKLEDLAARFSAWAAGNGLVMNAGKTQLIVSNSSKVPNDFNITVSGKVIKASDEFELLGVRFDRRLSTAPHDVMVAVAARQRASLISRLSRHLPKGRYLRQLATGLVQGKISHALPAVTTPRLDTAAGAPNESYKAVQRSLNDVARTITGTRRQEHVRIEDLLEAARIPSVNAMATSATAIETWKAYHSSDGPNGTRNPIGSHVFDGNTGNRGTRAASSGLVQIPLRGYNTMVVNAANTWNRCPDLRAAATLVEARGVAKRLAASVPL